ncbi:tRNA lysidine(34) synthetase TilS [Candidatus Methylomicrobium oryzae]|jgi:tRNA(Ile)-lysidine synthase|uniref:tRNA lysidine(34) synthetase TilS n=1 Tax=Candidatus Methylomicrobium oryzae TaxID=2802053 RepID=UPI0019209D4D|nr:tRNA lysidine(34) synthetase TilS [Methylomicrobium sp. RS1]MBL1262930.1 tRNA lysidine(34) synthetase TilS [Methylomicrobium sp. RS1]
MLTPRLIESSLALCQASPRRIFLAYSGGVDSHVLLHLCAQEPKLHERLTAVHVHHGLQVQAEDWARHAEATARGLGVNFLLRRVDAHSKPGESPEEAARNARYAALKPLMRPNDVLLVAQHQDDQLETVLLQLLRGGGLLGLAGMPESMPFGPGVLLRPFLHVRKQDIDRYALAHQLEWIEDPTNRESMYDRNFLRREVLPLLKQRWPACGRTVGRAAGHCSEAYAVLAEIAAESFAHVHSTRDNTLDIERLGAFDFRKRRLIIRHWFGQMDLKMPSQAFLAQLFDHVIGAAGDSDPVLNGQGCQIRRYRNKLYCLRNGQAEDLQPLDWPKEKESLMIGKRMTLSRVVSTAGIPESVWRQSTVTVKFRSGGEKIALPGRRGHHLLKNLYQEIGVPPWERAALPLLYLDGQLAAVADLWIGADYYREGPYPCFRPVLARH